MKDNHLFGRMVAFLVAATSLLPACSSQQLYGAGQQWQRNECEEMLDPDQRNRCLQSAATSYDEYQRQSDPVKGKK
jgi:hypothetical protein